MRLRVFGKLNDKYKIENDNSTLKPIEPLSRIDSLKPLDTVTSDQESFLLDEKKNIIKEINDVLNACNELIKKYNLISDMDYKVHGSGFSNVALIKEFKARLETFLRMLESRTFIDGLNDLLDDICTYLYRIGMDLPFISDEINTKYNVTVVEEGYRFTGTSISKWREEAVQIFINIDLSIYNDYQLKEYVIAYKNGMSAETIISIMDPRRAPEHIRLMFLLPDKELVEVFEHPEYSVNKVKSLFPDLVEEIKNKKGLI